MAILPPSGKFCQAGKWHVCLMLSPVGVILGVMKRLIVATFGVAIAFSLILEVCEAGTRKYYKPSLYGETLAACSANGTGCGKPVADKYCKNRGYEQALSFRLNRNPQGITRARTISNQLVNVSAKQPAFVFVKCYTSQTADRR
jgi:hypothetical protein